jgi:hypothetical protein
LILEISPEDRAQAAAAERRRAAEESRLKVEAEEAASTLPETLPKAPKTAKTPKTAKAPKISKTLTVKAKKAASVASEPLTPPPPSSVEEWIVRGSDAPLAPDVTWDKTLHWKTRVRLAVEKYVDDEKTLELILRYEAPTVAKLIREAVDRTRAARSASAVENL